MRDAGLQELAGADEPFDHFPADRSHQGNFERGLSRTLQNKIRILDSECVQRVPAGDHVRFGLIACRLRGLQVGLRDGAVLVKILGARIGFVGEQKSVFRLDIRGARN